MLLFLPLFLTQLYSFCFVVFIIKLRLIQFCQPNLDVLVSDKCFICRIKLFHLLVYGDSIVFKSLNVVVLLF